MVEKNSNEVIEGRALDSVVVIELLEEVILLVTDSKEKLVFLERL